VWLYFRFTLSFRDVEELMAERGIDVSYETSRIDSPSIQPINFRD
jgi:putative transposase